MRYLLLIALVLPMALTNACGQGASDPVTATNPSGTTMDGGVGQSPDMSAGTPGDPTQTPPQGKAAIDRWLDGLYYKTWRCEPSIMDPTSRA
jgi:hypothetical protein